MQISCSPSPLYLFSITISLYSVTLYLFSITWPAANKHFHSDGNAADMRRCPRVLMSCFCLHVLVEAPGIPLDRFLLPHPCLSSFSTAPSMLQSLCIQSRYIPRSHNASPSSCLSLSSHSSLQTALRPSKLLKCRLTQPRACFQLCGCTS